MTKTVARINKVCNESPLLSIHLLDVVSAEEMNMSNSIDQCCLC
jgi:hypothetical protein